MILLLWREHVARDQKEDQDSPIVQFDTTLTHCSFPLNHNIANTNSVYPHLSGFFVLSAFSGGRVST